MTDDERKRRLEEALRIAERVGNTFMAANIRKALQEHLEGYNGGPKNLT